MNKLTIDDVVDITWNFGDRFLLQTADAAYVWYSPDYGGDNTIHKYGGDPSNFTEPGFAGRYKGQHTIRRYCGPDVKIVEDW